MQLVWFRNDLRLDDNPALYFACQQAIKNKESVSVVYIASPKQWQAHNESPRKLGLIQETLKCLQSKLAGLGISFELLEADSFIEIPRVLSAYCLKHEVSKLYFNREIPLNEQRRDKAVQAEMSKIDIAVECYADDRIVHRNLLSKQGAVYRVFTPWYKSWVQELFNALPEVLPSPEAVSSPVTTTQEISLSGAEVFREDIWLSDEADVLALLDRFCRRKAAGYEASRDYPAIAGTSVISPYLAIGSLSARRCFHQLIFSCGEQGLHVGEAINHVWTRELAWRDFYRYLMLNFEHISRGENFKTEPLARAWRVDAEARAAWQTGKTGFPIIDAAMRQLLQTGWMHNRLRMLVASFFCKLLCLDWREGEKFFMEHLLDGDFASNNGGWQWSSSTGCDASPWFRIFNPTTQSEKFDKDGEFIKRFVPELATLDAKSIHCPSPEQRLVLGYPEPIIDYKTARQQALDFFKV